MYVYSHPDRMVFSRHCPHFMNNSRQFHTDQLHCPTLYVHVHHLHHGIIPVSSRPYPLINGQSLTKWPIAFVAGCLPDYHWLFAADNQPSCDVIELTCRACKCYATAQQPANWFWTKIASHTKECWEIVDRLKNGPALVWSPASFEMWRTKLWRSCQKHSDLSTKE